MSTGAVDAIVFDFDGLILDTEMPVFTAWQEAFVAHGCPPLTIEEWSAEIGTTGALDMVALLQARATRPVDIDAMHDLRRARRDQLLAEQAVLPGVVEWLDEAEALQLPVAIASSSPPDWVLPHLERLGLVERFDYIACATDGLPAKPAPHTYLAACAALGVEPEHALAVEDSPNGALAARRAGLRCVVVPHALTEELDLAHAHLRLRSLDEMSLREVLAHFDNARAG
jgi:HAD superfamily hydrolase (TIGR01509 family)